MRKLSIIDSHTGGEPTRIVIDGGPEWIQESIIGSSFTGKFRWHKRPRGEILPVVTGTARVNAEITLLLDENDPLCRGIR